MLEVVVEVEVEVVDFDVVDEEVDVLEVLVLVVDCTYTDAITLSAGAANIIAISTIDDNSANRSILVPFTT